ncbi:hypothetical protein MHBO_003842 [Bonamia ostreae]|uniref:Uncharacterized protein n=1 Tax=Bonamia ostreae TaxID=126728 RepID=A0ABV2ARP1_9EUKA
MLELYNRKKNESKNSPESKKFFESIRKEIESVLNDMNYLSKSNIAKKDSPSKILSTSEKSVQLILKDTLKKKKLEDENTKTKSNKTPKKSPKLEVNSLIEDSKYRKMRKIAKESVIKSSGKTSIGRTKGFNSNSK